MHKPMKWFLSWQESHAKKNVKYFQHNYDKYEVKVLEFRYPKSPAWGAWVVGINFERKDVRDGHLTCPGTIHHWVDVSNFMSRNKNTK